LTGGKRLVRPARLGSLSLADNTNSRLRCGTHTTVIPKGLNGTSSKQVQGEGLTLGLPRVGENRQRAGVPLRPLTLFFSEITASSYSF
jgi:hypothetical protein